MGDYCSHCAVAGKKKSENWSRFIASLAPFWSFSKRRTSGLLIQELVLVCATKTIGLPQMDSAAIRALAQALSDAETSAQEIPLLEKAVEMCEHSGGVRSTILSTLCATTLRELAEKLCTIPQYASALRRVGQALTVLAELDQDDPAVMELLASCDNIRGNALDGLGRPAESLLAHMSAVRRYELIGPIAVTAASLGNLGQQLSEVGRHEEALRYMRRAEARVAATQEDSHDFVLRAGLAYASGGILACLGRSEESLASYRLSKSHFIRSGGAHYIGVAQGSTSIGIALIKMGDLPGATAQLREASEGGMTKKGLLCMELWDHWR